MGFGKLCLFVIASSVICARVCIRIQVDRWFFVEISQQWSRYDEAREESVGDYSVPGIITQYQ